MFLENIASILLVLHLLAVLGTIILLIAGASYLVFASDKNWITGVKASLYGAYGYIVSFVIGLLIYPVFRVDVRAADFDKLKPWATGIFEIKEHIGAIALFAAIAIIVLASSTDEKSDNSRKYLFSFLVGLTFFVFLIKFISGFILTGINRM